MKARSLREQIVNTQHLDTIVGWMLAVVGSVVYLLTMEPTVSFWDCGEFIAVSHLLQVGHPPGAPFYQLLAHIFTLFSFGNPQAVAWCSNALSAIAGGLTVMFLYWIILLLRQPETHLSLRHHAGAVVGAMCYLFCDTAWFSATESEVYSLAMLEASVLIWSMLRWYHAADRHLAQRWLLLIGLLLGLGYCTHQLVLLTSPVLLLIFLFKVFQLRKQGATLNVRGFVVRCVPMVLLFFAIGLTPYLIVPIRAAADTPINECHSASREDVRAYLNRDRYEKAPLYPRMWRHRPNDALYYSTWNGGDTNLVGNLQFYGSYQLSYMYLRYLMWNFSGRYNDRQGYGSPQNGQFITGIPFFDNLLVSSAKTPPQSLHTQGHNAYYLLPLLLGILGMICLYDDRRMFWTVMTLFLMGGIILSLYLNHPCYEPRERDYAYVLSFFAFCIFIGMGAQWTIGRVASLAAKVRCKTVLGSSVATVLLLCVPLLMACQNWDDHDRSHRFIAHDVATNILGSCDSHPNGTLVFCYGDNDTFPLWYLQSVEDARPDIRVENIGLIGWRNFLELMEAGIENQCPIYFTHYAYNQFHDYFPNRFQLEGYTYRLMDEPCDSVAVEPGFRHVMDSLGWHSLHEVYVDEVGCKFLEMYWRDVLLIANNLSDQNRSRDSKAVLDKTRAEIPLHHLQDVRLYYSVAQAYEHAGDTLTARSIKAELKAMLSEQLAYYHAMPKSRQRVMPFTLGPREELYAQLLSEQ